MDGRNELLAPAVDRLDDATRPSILIVEDDEDIADSTRYNLERETYQVRVATTGEDALDNIMAGPPSLVLLDLNLPLMNGFEIAAGLERRRQRPDCLS